MAHEGRKELAEWRKGRYVLIDLWEPVFAHDDIIHFILQVQQGRKHEVRRFSI
jgi:hypothetical protein